MLNESTYIVEHLLTGGAAIVGALFLGRIIGSRINRTAVEVAQGIMLAYGIVYGVVFVAVYVAVNILPTFLPR
jgi:hypothetical protein